MLRLNESPYCKAKCSCGQQVDLKIVLRRIHFHLRFGVNSVKVT